MGNGLGVEEDRNVAAISGDGSGGVRRQPPREYLSVGLCTEQLLGLGFPTFLT